MTKFVGSRVMVESHCYMDITQRLLYENERLKGRVEVSEKVMGVLDIRVNEITNGVYVMKQAMPHSQVLGV